MTKREVLIAICETPGWEPPEDSSSLDAALSQLLTDDLIRPRLSVSGRDGGYEATPAALDAYPAFLGTDMADHNPELKLKPSLILPDDTWQEHTLETLLVRDGQRVDAKIAIAGLALDGVVSITNMATFKDLTEVEITIRTRTVSDR